MGMLGSLRPESTTRSVSPNGIVGVKTKKVDEVDLDDRPSSQRDATSLNLNS